MDSGTNNPVLQVPVLEYYPINLSTNKRFGSELSITYTPSRSVRINGSFTLNSTKIRGNYLEQSFDSDDTNWSARFNGFIRLPKDYSLQFFGFLRGPSENAFSKSKAFGFTTAAIQKSILDKKGNISLRYSDLFSLILYEKVNIKDGSLHWPSDSELNVSLVVVDLHLPVLNKSEYLSEIFPFLSSMLFWIAAVVNGESHL